MPWHLAESVMCPNQSMQVPQYDAAAFSADVIDNWGHLSSALREDQGELHSQMHALGDLCKREPSAGREILVFLENVLVDPHASSEIENAVAISFLDWSEIDSLGFRTGLGPVVSDVVRTQWERFNGASRSR